MGLLDSLLSNNSGGGLFDSLFYPTSAPDAGAEKKKQDAAFLAALGQDPYQGVSNPNATPMFQGSGGSFPINNLAPTNVPALAGTNAGAYGGGSSPFGLGGFNLPPTSQGAPASGAFPAVPAMQSPQAPQAAPQMPQMAPPPQMSAPAPQNGPSGSMSIGGYQMPQFGSRADYTPQAGAPSMDISAQSRQPQPDQSQGLPSVLQTPSILGRIGNPDGLIARLTGNDSRSISQQNLRATFDATRAVLLQSGMSNQEATSKAMLAVLNPEAGKTILPEALSNKQEFKTIKDSFGNETPIFVDKVNHSVTDVNGRPYGQAGGAASGGGVEEIANKITDLRGKGATQEQALNAVPPMYRGYVKSLIAGDALPSNIGRSQARGALMTLAHAVDDHFDESLIPQRMTYARGIGDTKTVSAPGGQRQAINTGSGHFADLAEALVAQNNVNGGPLAGLPGSAPAATAYNAIANSSSKNSENSAKILQEAEATAGEMGKLYSGSQGGGQKEREATKSHYSPNIPPLQAAGALEATRQLFEDKIRSNEAARDQAFGPEAKARIDFEDATVKRNLARVDASIAKLKGETAPASGGIPSGWTVRQR